MKDSENDVNSTTVGSEVSQQGFDRSPQETASCWSKIVFSWITPLMVRGVQQPLQTNDLYPLTPTETSRYQHQLLRKQWLLELQQPQPSLLRALWRTYRYKLLLSLFLDCVMSVVGFAAPVALHQIVVFLQKRQDTNTNDPWGYAIAGCFFGAILIRSLVSNQLLRQWYLLYAHIQASVSALAYEKLHRIGDTEKAVLGSGRILNHFAADPDCVGKFSCLASSLWKSPLETLVITGMLWYYLGIAAFAGLGVMVALLVLCGSILRSVGKVVGKQYAFTDLRVKTVREVLRGIKLIKCSAWERVMNAKVAEARHHEVNCFFRVAVMRSANYGLVDATSVLVALASFGTFARVSETPLTAAAAFTSLSLFAMIQAPMRRFPITIECWIQARLSLKRLNEFLLVDQVEDIFARYLPPILSPDVAVRLLHADFVIRVRQPSTSPEHECGTKTASNDTATESSSIEMQELNQSTWPKEQDSMALTDIHMRDVTLDIARNKLTMIVGPVGSGKTCLLNAILGEMTYRPREGSERSLCSSNVSYVPQQPWILNSTIQENILFGHELDEARLAQALKDSCLDEDLAVLPAGLQTEVGERGVTLSGGQKQRVAIARAIYAEHDIYIFDDPFSALDCDTGEKVFDRCLLGSLASKTRIVVTHALKFTPKAHELVVMENMTVKELGDYRTLRDKPDGLFHALFASGNEYVGPPPSPHAKREIGATEDAYEIESDGVDSEVTAEAADGSLISEETRYFGKLKLTLYLKYLRACGIAISGCSFLVFIMSKFALVASSVWLSRWTASKDSMNKFSLYLSVYAAIVGIATFLSVFARVIFGYGGMRASIRLHDQMLTGMLGAPMVFFDVTPIGRILNRFSRDMTLIDTRLNEYLGNLISNFFFISGMITTQCLFMPLLCAVYLPVMVPFGILGHYYRMCARELQRLDAVSRSPVCAHVDQTLNGLASLRISQSTQRFVEAFYRHFDAYLRASMPNLYVLCWIFIRAEFIGVLCCFAVAMLLVSPVTSISPSIGGLLLSYTLNSVETYKFFLRDFVDAEHYMTSAERVDEYSRIKQEESLELSPTVPDQWPTVGEIVFDQVCLRYRPNSDLVLRQTTFTIEAGQRVGLCGRTGSGKSTILQALFRVVNYESGEIRIDGVAISLLPLTTLRSQMAVLPQESVLFAQSIRFNLDPFEKHSDEELWDALAKSKLNEVVGEFPDKLEHVVDEDGANFSAGEKQLFALARAILRMQTARILFLDEATASVDEATDAFIQEKLRTEFADRTVIIIAHRLDSIISVDKIMVLDNGQVVESGSPYELLVLAGVDGVFQRLAGADVLRLRGLVGGNS